MFSAPNCFYRCGNFVVILQIRGTYFIQFDPPPRQAERSLILKPIQWHLLSRKRESDWVLLNTTKSFPLSPSGMFLTSIFSKQTCMFFRKTTRLNYPKMNPWRNKIRLNVGSSLLQLILWQNIRSIRQNCDMCRYITSIDCTGFPVSSTKCFLPLSNYVKNSVLSLFLSLGKVLKLILM